jgi:outer membrane lipoprotein-sorting protein
LLAICVLLSLASSNSAAPPAQPAAAPAPIDPALLKRLTEIDSRASQIKTLSANFEQKKFTALLRRPLVSSGKVKVKGATMRWDTEKPEPTVMVVGEKTVQIYYPAQKTVEEYTLDQRLAELAASPLPRLGVLKDRFAIVEIAPHDIDPKADPQKTLALKLTPIEKELADHVQEVRVLLDIGGGYIVQAEFTDADGDRTVIQFRNIAANADVGDLELKVPPGTKFTRPLEGMKDLPPARSK